MVSSPELADTVKGNTDANGPASNSSVAMNDQQHDGRSSEMQGRDGVENETRPRSDPVVGNPDAVDTTGAISGIEHGWLEYGSPTTQESLTKSASEKDLARQPGVPTSANDKETFSTPDEDGPWTQLHAAVEAGDEEQVQRLIEKGELWESAASNGKRPLVIAADKGLANIVELLLNRSPVDYLSDIDQSTALTRACEERHDAVVKLLIEHGANIESKGRGGRTPLLIAVSWKNHDLVKYLLRHGADKTVALEDGNSAEDLAEGDQSLIELLRENTLVQGPEIGVKKSDPELGFRPVRSPEKPKGIKLAACEAFQAEVVQFFIGHREQRSQPVRVSVYELIYGKGPHALFSLRPMSPPPGSPTTSQADKAARGEPTFTWYHLPANNDLILRLLAERKPSAAMPDANFRSQLGLDKIKGRSGTLRSAAFSYMRPFAKAPKVGRWQHHKAFQEILTLSKTDTDMSWDMGKTEQAAAFVPFLNYETFADHMDMTPYLNGVKGFHRFVSRHAQLHRSQFNRPAMGPPRPFPMPLSPPPILGSFYPPHSRPPPPPPPFLGRPSIPNAARLPTPDVAPNLNMRGGSGPPSLVIVEGRPPKKPQKRFLSFFSGSKPSKSSKRKSKSAFDFEFMRQTRSENPHEHLIRGYGFADKDGQVPFQPRRTLDQYFYSHLDNTKHRDKDQVIYRYTRNEEAKIFMVDQMWLWIISGDTLITCIPDRWKDANPRSAPYLTTAVTEGDLVRGPSIERPGSPTMLDEPFMTPAHGNLYFVPETSERDHHHHHKDVDPGDGQDLSHEPPLLGVSPPPTGMRKPAPKTQRADDPMNIHHRVLRHLKEVSRDPIESIYDLAGLIATCCASAFEESQIPDDMQFFDFFERSISTINDKTTQCLHEFKTSLRSEHTHRHHTEHPPFNEKASLGDEPTDDDLNIATEIDLLVEIEDIQDELHILKVVLRDQKRALRQLDDILVQGKKRIRHAHDETAAKPMINLSCIEHHTARIGEMEKLAEKAYESLYHLIDLKQKQANFSEAISARKLARETAKNTELQFKQSEQISKQAEETARQGKTLMVFTVVTIIFLPLSFMAAFFAINIDVFPVNEDDKLEFGYILKYMLSISLALAIPFVLLALRINDVKQVGRSAHRGLRRAWLSPRLIPVMCYVTLALLGVVVPSIVWTSNLATTAKVAVTILLGITVVLVAIGLAIKRIAVVATRPVLSVSDSRSYLSG